jgi:hypothetical protein
MEQTYFPYANSYRTVYRMSFPTQAGGRPTLNHDAKWFGLRFAGAQGTAKVVWELN